MALCTCWAFMRASAELSHSKAEDLSLKHCMLPQGHACHAQCEVNTGNVEAAVPLHDTSRRLMHLKWSNFQCTIAAWARAEPDLRSAMQHMRPPMAMSEQLYRPHVRPPRLASQSSLPSSTSGMLTPHQSGSMSPMMSQSSGQLGSGQLHGHGPHAPYGPYGPMAIPPGFILVPAPQVSGTIVYPHPQPCLVLRMLPAS